LKEYLFMGIASRHIRATPVPKGDLGDGAMGQSDLGQAADLPVVGLASQQLAQAIERVVRDRIGSKIQGLKVEVRREGIVLLGVCPTFYVQQLAQHAAMRVAGQTVITNEMKVI
jgi:hypothetical protein